MDNAVSLLPRQSGLLEATQVIANNIANAATPGFKGEATIFSEYVATAGRGNPSLSMGRLVGHATDLSGGALRNTGNTFDLAIDGEGFFKVTTPEGPQLTRAGVFNLDADGLLVDVHGAPVTDQGGSTIQIPDDARTVAIAKDGTISVDGDVFGAVGVFSPQGELVRSGSNYWTSTEGDTLIEEPVVLQGFVEQSNVSPVAEFAKLITAQRLFDAGQTMTQQEHDRLQTLIEAIRQS